MVNAFGSTCVLLWCDFLAFIYFIYSSFLFVPFFVYKEGTRDDHSKRLSLLFSWPIPASLAVVQKKLWSPGNDFNIFLFYFAIYSPLIVRFLLFQYVAMGCLRVYKTLFLFPPFRILSPSRDSFRSSVERRRQTKKECWRRQNSTHL